MRTLPTAMQTQLTQQVLTWVRCWLVIREDDVALGFTDHVRTLTIGGVTYIPGLIASALQSQEGLKVDNLELDTFLSLVAEQDVEAGRYDYASVQLFAVNYIDPSGIMILHKGRLGQISRADGNVSTEARGLAQQLGSQFGRVYAPLCDVDLGGVKCGVVLEGFSVLVTATFTTASNDIVRTDGGSWIGDGLRPGTQVAVTGTVSNNATFTLSAVTDGVLTVSTPPPVTEVGVEATFTFLSDFVVNGTITTVDALSPRRLFHDTTLVRPSDGLPFAGRWFHDGAVQMLTGTNQGVKRDVRASSSAGEIELYFDMPFDLAVTDTFAFTVGCDKLRSTCIDKFRNIANYRGFANIPTANAVHSLEVNFGRTTNFN